MADIFDKTVFKSKLLDYLGQYDVNHVGYVYSIDFERALVLTNDHWKSRVSGIPHNSFLVATAFNPEEPDATPSSFDHEVVLLRVQGPANLPSDGEMVGISPLFCRVFVDLQGWQQKEEIWTRRRRGRRWRTRASWAMMMRI